MVEQYSEIKIYLLNDFICTKFQKRQNYSEKSSSVVAGSRRRELTAEAPKGTFSVS